MWYGSGKVGSSCGLIFVIKCLRKLATRGFRVAPKQRRERPHESFNARPRRGKKLLGFVDLISARRRLLLVVASTVRHTISYRNNLSSFAFALVQSVPLASVSTHPVGVMPRPDQPPQQSCTNSKVAQTRRGREREGSGETRDTGGATANGFFRSVPSRSLSPSLSPSLRRGWLDHDAGAGGVQRGRSSLLIIIIVRRAWRRLDRSLALVDGGLLLF